MSTSAEDAPKPDNRRTPDAKTTPDGASESGLSQAEDREVEASSWASTPMIYEILRREGEQERDRHATSRLWSGVAAGLSISFSLVAQGVLESYLPDAPWRPPITSLGYTVGFLIAVLARHQLS